MPRLLAGHEQVIDALYLEIGHLASWQVPPGPVAHDLRSLLPVLRITPELERSHDLVTEAATRASSISAGDLTPRARGLAGQMVGRTAGTALAGQHQQMDLLHASITAELTTASMPAHATMEMALIAPCCQRLGAHAANIARRIAYLAGSPAG